MPFDEEVGGTQAPGGGSVITLIHMRRAISFTPRAPNVLRAQLRSFIMYCHRVSPTGQSSGYLLL